MRIKTILLAVSATVCVTFALPPEKDLNYRYRYIVNDPNTNDHKIHFEQKQGNQFKSGYSVRTIHPIPGDGGDRPGQSFIGVTRWTGGKIDKPGPGYGLLLDHGSHAELKSDDGKSVADWVGGKFDRPGPGYGLVLDHGSHAEKRINNDKDVVFSFGIHKLNKDNPHDYVNKDVVHSYAKDKPYDYDSKEVLPSYNKKNKPQVYVNKDIVHNYAKDKPYDYGNKEILPGYVPKNKPPQGYGYKDILLGYGKDKPQPYGHKAIPQKGTSGYILVPVYRKPEEQPKRVIFIKGIKGNGGNVVIIPNKPIYLGGRSFGDLGRFYKQTEDHIDKYGNYGPYIKPTLPPNKVIYRIRPKVVVISDKDDDHVDVKSRGDIDHEIRHKTPYRGFGDLGSHMYKGRDHDEGKDQGKYGTSYRWYKESNEGHNKDDHSSKVDRHYGDDKHTDDDHDDDHHESHDDHEESSREGHDDNEGEEHDNHKWHRGHEGHEDSHRSNSHEDDDDEDHYGKDGSKYRYYKKDYSDDDSKYRPYKKEESDHNHDDDDRGYEYSKWFVEKGHKGVVPGHSDLEEPPCKHID